MFDDPGFTWPRQKARRFASAKRGALWARQDVSQVKVFHFSGTSHQPWWYADLSPDDAWWAAASEWRNRDPRRLLASAVYEWVSAFGEVRSEITSWPAKERSLVEGVLDQLSKRAARYRSWANSFGSRRARCHHCKDWFAPDHGRWL